jgi:molecular chaperone GrpE (heat shock protein)
MEAITTIPASEQFPAGQVIDVLEPGYMYKERVLRAARVVVATE